MGSIRLFAFIKLTSGYNLEVWAVLGLMSQVQSRGIIFVYVTYCCFVQRITIAGIRNDEWCRKNYVPTRQYEEEDIDLDDVQAVFSDAEVINLRRIVPFVTMKHFVRSQSELLVHVKALAVTSNEKRSFCNRHVINVVDYTEKSAFKNPYRLVY
jgi:hypothetical protein